MLKLSEKKMKMGGKQMKDAAGRLRGDGFETWKEEKVC